MLQTGLLAYPAWQRSALPALLGFSPRLRAIPRSNFTPSITQGDIYQLLMGWILFDSVPLRRPLPPIPARQSAVPVSPSVGQSRSANLTNVGTTPAAPSNNNNTGRLRVAVIDQFAPDRSGFNHGRAISDEIRQGGGDPSLAGRIDTVEFNVAGGNTTQNIANALENVLQRVRNGEQIDAVNISQQDFTEGNDSQQVRSLIQQLTDLGIPVAVAAGNEGPNATNVLANNSAFTVQSATNGQINRSSGRGNVQANARSTSFATARLTPLLAQRRAQGMTISQIKSEIISDGGQLIN